MNNVSDRLRRIREWRCATHPGDPAISSQHWHDVNLLLNEVDRLGQLEAIVRDLAAASPLDYEDRAPTDGAATAQWTAKAVLCMHCQSSGARSPT